MWKLTITMQKKTQIIVNSRNGTKLRLLVNPPGTLHKDNPTLPTPKDGQLGASTSYATFFLLWAYPHKTTNANFVTVWMIHDTVTSLQPQVWLGCYGVEFTREWCRLHWRGHTPTRCTLMTRKCTTTTLIRTSLTPQICPRTCRKSKKFRIGSFSTITSRINSVICFDSSESCTHDQVHPLTLTNQWNCDLLSLTHTVSIKTTNPYDNEHHHVSYLVRSACLSC